MPKGESQPIPHMEGFRQGQFEAQFYPKSVSTSTQGNACLPNAVRQGMFPRLRRRFGGQGSGVFWTRS